MVIKNGRMSRVVKGIRDNGALTFNLVSLWSIFTVCIFLELLYIQVIFINFFISSSSSFFNFWVWKDIWG